MAEIKQEKQAEEKPKLTEEQLAKLDELWQQGENISHSAETFPFRRRPKGKDK